MRALQLKSIFTVPKTTAQLEEKKKIERERIQNVRPYVDTSPPISLNQMKDAAKSPSKRLFVKQELKIRMQKHNITLAKRIFSIMEGPGLVSILLDPENNKHLELHPGTINFNARLEEAQRIHKENTILASRLDAMQPFYKRSDFVGKLNRRNIAGNKKLKHNAIRTVFPEIDDDMVLTQRSDNIERDKKRNMKETLSARKPTYDQHRSIQVLLEYTKMQNGKILDVAVIKEPFQDRFVIFGIDLDVSQRYELRLTSEEISSILDGDILMTSLDNIEVWVVLLNKIVLPSVEMFTKLPVDVFSGKLLTQAQVDGLEPRPPSSKQGTRFSGRGGGSDKSSPVTSNQIEAIATPESKTELSPSMLPQSEVLSQLDDATKRITNYEMSKGTYEFVESKCVSIPVLKLNDPRNPRESLPQKPPAAPPNNMHSIPKPTPKKYNATCETPIKVSSKIVASNKPKVAVAFKHSPEKNIPENVKSVSKAETGGPKLRASTHTPAPPMMSKATKIAGRPFQSKTPQGGPVNRNATKNSVKRIVPTEESILSKSIVQSCIASALSNLLNRKSCHE